MDGRSFSAKVSEIQNQHPHWNRDDIILALKESEGNQAKALLMLMKEEKVIDTKKKPSNSGPSSFAGLLTCLNERDQQNSRSCGPPTLPDFFSGSPQDQPSPSTSQGKSSSTSQGKKRKPVSLDSGRVKRPKTAPTSADFWPEPDDDDFQLPKGRPTQRPQREKSTRTFTIDKEDSVDSGEGFIPSEDELSDFEEDDEFVVKPRVALSKKASSTEQKKQQNPSQKPRTNIQVNTKQPSITPTINLEDEDDLWMDTRDLPQLKTKGKPNPDVQSIKHLMGIKSDTKSTKPLSLQKKKNKNIIESEESLEEVKGIEADEGEEKQESRGIIPIIYEDEDAGRQKDEFEYQGEGEGEGEYETEAQGEFIPEVRGECEVENAEEGEDEGFYDEENQGDQQGSDIPVEYVGEEWDELAPNNEGANDEYYEEQGEGNYEEYDGDVDYKAENELLKARVQELEERNLQLTQENEMLRQKILGQHQGLDEPELDEFDSYEAVSGLPEKETASYTQARPKPKKPWVFPEEAIKNLENLSRRNIFK